MKEAFAINNGLFVFYLAFQVSQKMSLKAIKAKIEASPEVISYTRLYQGPQPNSQIIKHKIRESFQDFLEERRKKSEELITDYIQSEQEIIDNPEAVFNRFVKFTYMNQSRYPQYLIEFDYTVTINDQPEKWSIRATDPLRKSVYCSIDEVANHSNALSNILGQSLFSNKETYLLSPIKASYKDTVHYAIVSLELYSNNMAIIKVSIPFTKDMTEHIKYRSLCDIYEFSEYKYSRNYLCQSVIISDMNRHLDTRINSIFGDSLDSNIYISFEHIAINNYVPVFSNSSQISLEMKKEVQMYLYTDKFRSDISNSEVENFWEHNLVKINGCYFFFEESGRCFSLVGSECDRYNDLLHGDNQTYISANLLDSTLSLWVPSILFRKLSLLIVCRLTENNIFMFPEYKIRCLINNNYVDQMSDMCSVSTRNCFVQISNALKTRQYNKLFEEQIDRLEKVYVTKKENSKNGANRLVTISAFVITAVFSLPTIKSTVSIISTVYGVQQQSGDFVDLLSFLVWLAFLGVISILFIKIIGKLTNRKVRSWFN